ncbi:MAG TPA: hypothetical protein PLZ84_00460, partial [Clostridia bacterium]|nr:hypothetical protein [Clostridia bacterium]
GYNVSKIDLVNESGKMRPGDILVIGGLNTDLSQTEAEAAWNFIDNGGNMMVLFDYSENTYPVFEEFLDKYKITVPQGVIYERSPNYRYDQRYKNVIINDKSEHEILQGINENNQIILPDVQPVEVKDVNVSTGELTFGPYHGTVSMLISSSTTSYIKQDDTTTDYMPGDKTGPFATGLAYELSQTTDLRSRIVLFGTTNLYYYAAANLPGDFGLLINSFNWLADRGTLDIPSKSIQPSTLNIRNITTLKVVAFIVIIVIPILILGMGLFVWIRRKNR